MAQEAPERKRSGRIVLTIMGAAAGVVGLATMDEHKTLRNNYSSKEDCEADNAVGKCEYTAVDGRTAWYGPEYRDDWRQTGQGSPGRYYTWRESEASRSGGTAGSESVLHAPTSVTTVARGGFGGSGRGWSGS